MKFKPRNHDSGHGPSRSMANTACWPNFPRTPALEKLVSSLVIAEMSRKFPANQ